MPPLLKVRTPPTEPEWTQGEAAWTKLWRQIRRDLSGLALKSPELYYAGEPEDVWLWGRHMGGGAVWEYHVWLYSHNAGLLDGDLFPMSGKPTRIWNRHLGVWVDLGHLDRLHIGGKPHAKNPANLQGKRALTGLKLPTMVF
jgi:hypothetical protein